MAVPTAQGPGHSPSVPGPGALADNLLAPLASESYVHQRDQGRTPAEITDALTHLAHGVLTLDAGPGGP
ncbi:hypothetical protein [Spirillospora sp. NPDC047279]|uniref:hypothetical protein n=1 Tax=Spirillospora sp. NPDC047279 TaxID=3155478 RepID=UPI0033CF68D7